MWTEERVFSAIYRTYGPIGANMGNICVRHAPSYVMRPSKWGKEVETKRYIDALVVKDQFKTRWGIEIKVTPQDLKSEVSDLQKSRAWAERVHSFYLAVPPDLLELATQITPPEWGLIVVRPHPVPKYEKVAVVRRAKKNSTPLELEPRTLWSLVRIKGKKDFEQCTLGS